MNHPTNVHEDVIKSSYQGLVSVKINRSPQISNDDKNGEMVFRNRILYLVDSAQMSGTSRVK